MQPNAGSLQRMVWSCDLQSAIIPGMMKTNKKIASLLAVMVVLSAAALLKSATLPPGSGPEYTSDAQLKLPENYRQWTYLTSGFDMSYSPNAMGMDHHMFDNVFANPESYKVFQETGTWPDKTVLVLEGRMAEGKGSINQRGNYQSTRNHGHRGACKGRGAFSGQVGVLHFRRREDRQNGSDEHGVLHVPCRPRGGRYNVRAVLSHAAPSCEEQGNTERRVHEGKRKRCAEVGFE